METMIKEDEIYETINKKVGEIVSLSVEKLIPSEYNTRCTCIDREHVENLAVKIRKRGFQLKRALSVNVISGASGADVAYRVAAGIHRLEAAKMVGLTEIPCLIYYDLTDEEECVLDGWDNEMDEDHKKAHFLQEAEHYRYLQEIKGWSQRQMARNKRINLRDVNYRIQISKLPEEAKKIIRGVSPGKHFFEKYFRDICKLSDPHIIAICEEIAEKGRQADMGKMDDRGNTIQPMKQAEIKKRVEELLKKEKEGDIDRTVKIPAPEGKMELNQREEKVSPQEDEEERCLMGTIENEDKKMETKENAKSGKPRVTEETLEIPIEFSHEIQGQTIKGMKLNMCTAWVKLSGLLQEIGQTGYIVLKKIEEYEMLYRPHTDEPFFFGKEYAKDPFAIIAIASGVDKEHLKKRVLPFLKQKGYINYWSESGVWWFKIQWKKFIEIYCKKAYTIPYEEGGLKGVSEKFSGAVHPTPKHYLRIEKGKAVSWNCLGTTEMTVREEDLEEDELRKKLLSFSPPMSEGGIAECLQRREDTENALRLMFEQKKRTRIGNEAGYILTMVQSGPGIPEGFVTPKQEKEREEKERKLKEFIQWFKEVRPQCFCLNKDKKYEIEAVDDNGFTFLKGNSDWGYQFFERVMDKKYFEQFLGQEEARI